MQRANRKAIDTPGQPQSPHAKPGERSARKSTGAAEMTSLRKRLLEMIVRHETERKAKPK